MNNEDLQRLWEAINETHKLVQSVKNDVADLAASMHSESQQAILDTQEGLAEVVGMLVPEDEEEVSE